jgi:hypothetical protein
VEQQRDQDPQEVLKALLLSAGSSAGAAGGCGQASAHHDGLHQVIRAVAPSGGPGGLYTAVAFPSTEYGPLFAEYVTQHKEESGKHQLIMMASMKVIRVIAPSGGPTMAWVAAGLEDEASSVQPASCKRRSRLRGACVADGGKSSKLIVCKSPGVNIEIREMPYVALFVSLTLAVTAFRSNKR